VGGLEEMIDRARSLQGLHELAASKAAKKLAQALKATAAAGTTPDGKGWAPTKAGGRAMAGAAGHVRVMALGPVVRVVLDGFEVYHHYGKGKTEVRRQVIPDAGAGVPELVARIVKEAADEAFAELTGTRQ
jgi:hypothetical protein